MVSATSGPEPIQLVDSRWSDAGAIRTITVTAAVRGPIGGVPTYFAVLDCFGPSEGGMGQLVAFRRSAGDVFEPLAVVVRTGGDIDFIGSARFRTLDDRINVDVEHAMIAGSAAPSGSTLRQERVYSWDGQRFTQTGGPLAFAVPESVARVTVPRPVTSWWPRRRTVAAPPP